MQERRVASKSLPDSEETIQRLEQQLLRHDGLILKEVTDMIELAPYQETSKTTDPTNTSPGNMELSDTVKDQLHDYIQVVASIYRDNPFHNFEHASHVTMSVVKLLSRIIAPSRTTHIESTEDEDNPTTKNQRALHDHTYGITSDPLTQFSCKSMRKSQTKFDFEGNHSQVADVLVFLRFMYGPILYIGALAAMIHDLDHTGVPNRTLVQEGCALAQTYHNKSVAEQHSVHLAWSLLLQEEYHAPSIRPRPKPNGFVNSWSNWSWRQM